MKTFISMLLVICMMAALFAGCGNKLEVAAPAATEAPAAEAPAATEAAAPAELTFAQGTVLRMATGYNSTKTGLFFDAETAGEGV